MKAQAGARTRTRDVYIDCAFHRIEQLFEEKSLVPTSVSKGLGYHHPFPGEYGFGEVVSDEKLSQDSKRYHFHHEVPTFEQEISRQLHQIEAQICRKFAELK